MIVWIKYNNHFLLDFRLLWLTFLIMVAPAIEKRNRIIKYIIAFLKVNLGSITEDCY